MIWLLVFGPSAFVLALLVLAAFIDSADGGDSWSAPDDDGSESHG